MSHLAQSYSNSNGGSNYYEQQSQQQQPMQHSRGSGLMQSAPGGVAPPSHYALGPYQQANMQQQQQTLSHKQPSPNPSPYRGQQQQLNTQLGPHHSPHTMQMQQQQQQQPPHMLHQHPTRPISSSGASFKRELFPHEIAQQGQQQQQPPHRQPSSSFAGLAGLGGGGVPGSKDGANISPPPGSDEFYFHEANVRSLTESPSPPPPQQQQSLNHPPEQVAHMLSQIIKKQQQAAQGQGQGQQQHSSQHQQMLAQQQAAQQQAQRAELYNHFQSSGYKPTGLHSQQQPQQNHYASPAASIQLSQSQAHSAHTQLASHYNRAQPSSDAMRLPQQQQQSSYYDQPPPQAQHGPYSTHMHQQPQSQQHQLQGSPYGGVGSKSASLGGVVGGLSASQQQQQHHSPSQIPGMSNVVDPEYIRMLKRRQAELIEMQNQEQIRAAQIRMQQQQQHGGGMQMRQQQLLDPQLDHHQQSSFAAPSALPLHDPYAAQAPPPLQGRSQSLPAADQYGQIHTNVSSHGGYYSEGPTSLQHAQYRSDGYAQQPQLQQQQLQHGGMAQHSVYSNSGPGMQPPHLQQQQLQQQHHSLPYASAGSGSGSLPPPGISGMSLGLGGVAAPPGFKAGGTEGSGNSPPQQGRQQYQQSQQQQPQSSRYDQMQQLKQIVGNVNSASEADFRGGAASPNFGATPNSSNVTSVHYPPPSGGAGGSTGRVPTAPYPRRSQSLGDPNGTGGNGNMGMGVGAPPPPVSHEAVPISLGGRRGAAASGSEGAEGGGEQRGRVVAAANLSRFSAGPPNQDSRGFVARCCTEARRGGRGGSHLSPSAANSLSSSAASSSSSVLTRASFGTRRTSKDYTQLAGGSSYVPLNQYNPFSNLSSSPDLAESASSPSPSPPASANGGSERDTWGPRGDGTKPAPLNMASSSFGGSGSGQTTPCQSPTTKQQPAPRARMQTPLLPPMPK